MKLIKVKGIVIKEIPYKDNDKIITILTDSLGKISCMAKGAKKTNSPILANCQFLVYSEFVLYQGTSFYHVNSASILNTFYHLRIDFDKLQMVFDLTRLLQQVTDENEDTSQVLKLFLNTVYLLETSDKDPKFLMSVFKIRLFSILGFTPRLDFCHTCGQAFSKEMLAKSEIYYDYVSNIFFCSDCIQGIDKRRYIAIHESTLVAIKYVLLSQMSKIFSFELKDMNNFVLFGQVYTDAITNGI